MRTFKMIRNADESGVSGTGHVLDGVEWHTGQVTVCWRTKTPSLGYYDSFQDFQTLHIDSHPTNGTEVVWDDD
jgi:hypothetical protein